MKSVFEEFSGTIEIIAGLLANCLNKGGTLFWCGNGGSACDCQHLSAELLVRFKKDRRALRTVALTADTSVLTCTANDYSYADIFAKQIEALGRSEDILIAFSTSGQSENILQAITTAKKLGLTTVALLGKGGGVAKELANYCMVIPSDISSRIQEAHILIGHTLCELIEHELGFV